MHIVTTFLRNVFKKLKKRACHFRTTLPHHPFNLKKILTTRGDQKNSLQLDEKIKSLAIIVAKK